jgi:hypothetical protein
LEEICESGELLGVQSPSDSDIVAKRRFSGKNHHIQQIRVRRSRIDATKEAKIIRRINGNHRLAFAEHLEVDPNLQQKYLASFCMILLRSPGAIADDYAESLIFEPRDGSDRPPFDLNTFKYVPISQAAEIPNKVKPEIIAILRDCGANI